MFGFYFMHALKLGGYIMKNCIAVEKQICSCNKATAFLLVVTVTINDHTQPPVCNISSLTCS